MSLTERFKEIVDEYNSKREIESDKIIFDKSSNSYYFRRLFTNLLTINSDFITYSSFLDIVKEDEDLRKILEIVEEEKMKRNELIWNIEKAVGWINGEILNYEEVSNFFKIDKNMYKVTIFHRNDILMTVSLEDFELKEGIKQVSGFEEYITKLCIMLKNIIRGNYVFSISEGKDDEYVLYNLFILNVDKFKKSKYVVFDSNSSLVEKDIIGSFGKLKISDKYRLGFSNRVYVEEYYADNFEKCIELIYKEDESIEKKVTDIMLDVNYNISFEDVKVYDKKDMIEIDTKLVKFIYNKEDKKLMVCRVEDFDFEDLSDLSEDVEGIEDEIGKLL